MGSRHRIDSRIAIALHERRKGCRRKVDVLTLWKLQSHPNCTCPPTSSNHWPTADRVPTRLHTAEPCKECG